MSSIRMIDSRIIAFLTYFIRCQTGGVAIFSRHPTLRSRRIIKHASPNKGNQEEIEWKTNCDLLLNLALRWCVFHLFSPFFSFAISDESTVSSLDSICCRESMPLFHSLWSRGEFILLIFSLIWCAISAKRKWAKSHSISSSWKALISIESRLFNQMILNTSILYSAAP